MPIWATACLHSILVAMSFLLILFACRWTRVNTWCNLRCIGCDSEKLGTHDIWNNLEPNTRLYTEDSRSQRLFYELSRNIGSGYSLCQVILLWCYFQSLTGNDNRLVRYFFFLCHNVNSAVMRLEVVYKISLSKGILQPIVAQHGFLLSARCSCLRKPVMSVNSFVVG